jgi:primosomal protein N' (replication factor Y)
MTRRAKDIQSTHLWVEEGETRTAPLITVAPAAPIDKVYTYTASEELVARLRVGQRVVVPFGRKSTPAPAFVVASDTGPWSSTLKPVMDIPDPDGFLSEELLALGKWIARYYCCPLGRTLASMIPVAVR